MAFKAISINIRHDEDRWLERARLLIDEIIKVDPDIIGIQEVSVPIDQAKWIQEELNKDQNYSYKLFQWNKIGKEGALEGIAILTRLKEIGLHEGLDLGDGGRIAQRILLETKDGYKIQCYNAHLHHMPLDNEEIRLQQVTEILRWTENDSGEPQILCFDLNALPSSSTVDRIKKSYPSAFESCNGHEPEFTYPTPLVTAKGAWYKPRTIDYIFYNPSRLKPNSARLIFKEADERDGSLYPSDHFGIYAAFDFMTGTKRIG